MWNCECFFIVNQLEKGRLHLYFILSLRTCLQWMWWNVLLKCSLEILPPFCLIICHPFSYLTSHHFGLLYWCKSKQNSWYLYKTYLVQEYFDYCWSQYRVNWWASFASLLEISVYYMSDQIIGICTGQARHRCFCSNILNYNYNNNVDCLLRACKNCSLDI